ncbi:cell division protein ZipA [Alteromonas gilva]|uniref:Cell division protein ZipA n=1 Tax=Alteromonas gilva TaxID=2987522 RepID=A0ABT5L218_9ALTE|nr:cell division protein ZipA [Alteromonas gilva]MDC8830927.1 cell division protein ZipA [Alteromonas gilva]
MEEELRLSLLLLGGFFIFGVLAHGLWNIRKNSQAKRPQRRVEPEDWQHNSADEQDAAENSQGFDEYGVGEVRVVNTDIPTSTDDDADEDAVNDSEDDHAHTVQLSAGENEHVSSMADAEPATAAEQRAIEAEKIYASVVSNPKPQFAKGHPDSVPDSVPAPPAFLLKEANENAEKARPMADESAGQTPKHTPEDDFSLDVQAAPESVDARKEPEAINLSDQQSSNRKNAAKKRPRQGSRRRQEPNFGDDEQMQIDFDDSAKAAASDSTKGPQVEPEVLILNVRAPEDAPISGAALLPMLLTLGFKFGEQDIFHRHVNSNGKGPVLFSLANMFKPGNFDIDNLETFTTRGISLFMLLPIEGDPHQVFNMMHNAARKIADEFNAQVLDGRRSVLTKQGLQQYVEKIRDFERKRMIAKQ